MKKQYIQPTMTEFVVESSMPIAASLSVDNTKSIENDDAILSREWGGGSLWDDDEE